MTVGYENCRHVRAVYTLVVFFLFHQFKNKSKIKNNEISLLVVLRSKPLISLATPTDSWSFRNSFDVARLSSTVFSLLLTFVVTSLKYSVSREKELGWKCHTRNQCAERGCRVTWEKGLSEFKLAQHVDLIENLLNFLRTRRRGFEELAKFKYL